MRIIITFERNDFTRKTFVSHGNTDDYHSALQFEFDGRRKQVVDALYDPENMEQLATSGQEYP